MTEKIVQVPVTRLKPAIYNPRKFSAQAHKDLTSSIKKFGMVDPIIANSAPARKDIVIGGPGRQLVPIPDTHGMRAPSGFPGWMDSRRQGL